MVRQQTVNRLFRVRTTKKPALLLVLSVSKGATGQLIEIIQIIKSSLFWRMVDG
jgi:hypothetical protein